MKKIIAIILATCMFVSFGIIANAATAPESEIMPLWDNISSLTNAFSFSGSMGTVDCEIYGDAGTTVTANVKVYRQTSTGGWSKPATIPTLSILRSFSAENGRNGSNAIASDAQI